jgi:hypothetical protein
MSEDITTRARRRTRRVVAAGFGVVLLAAVLVVGLVAALGHRGGPVSARPPGPDGGPGASAPVTAGPPPATTSASPLPVDDLSWVSVAGASLPVSASAGPRDTGDGRARGFAHSPLGAVLAAAHISVRLCPQVGPAVFGATVRDQVVGANTAALARHLDDDYQQARAQLGVPYGQPAGRLYSTTRGYRVDAQTDQAATVRLLLEGPGQAGGSVLVAVVVHLQWTGADWALVAPAGGVWDTDTAVITDASGYVRFPDGG